MSTSDDTAFAQEALRRGLATEQQLEECRDLQALCKRHFQLVVPLPAMMLCRGLVNVGDIRNALQAIGGSGEQGKRTQRLLGRLAIERGLVSRDTLLSCLDQQEEGDQLGESRPLGTILMAEGHLKPDQLADLLAAQRDLLEVGGDDIFSDLR